MLLAATTTLANAGWTDGNQIISDTIWRPDFHGFYVQGGTFHNPGNCIPPSAQSLYLFDPTDEAADPKLIDRLFAMILMAHASKKKVYVYVDGCVGGYPRIRGLQVRE